MIRMIQSQSAGQAKAYFTDALMKSDYFLNDQELAGFWQGKLAERLGLEGLTTKDAFFALAENRNPQSGKPLTPRTKSNRTTGYDINFHCPKSVSVLHALSKDDHIQQAFQSSVTNTMRLIEEDGKTRIRQGGKYADRTTGELVWSHFTHQTARPVTGFAPDPHLHSHCYVFNATWDAEEGRFKAGQFRDIMQGMPDYQMHFHKVLSDKLMELGYAISKTDRSFEIEGVPQAVIDLFSKRTNEIGRVAAEKGITDPKELSELGARTRAKKQKGYSMAELGNEWRQQVRDLGEEGLRNAVIRDTSRIEPPSLTVKQCVDHAIEHCFERASVVPEQRLRSEAYQYSIGKASVSVADITRAFVEDDRLIRVKDGGKTLCTTQEVIEEERRMVTLARQGQGKLIPTYREAPELSLQGQQEAAVKFVLTTANRVSIIRGGAGTGKTTLMKEAVEKFSEAGKSVAVIAPTAQASRGVLRGEGFDKANTVAKLLADEKMQSDLKDQVLWVDEAGLLGIKDMTALIDLATKQNAQLILGGDTRQHSSVVRGDALRILNTVAGIEVAEVSKIYRMRDNEYKEAVEHLAKGDVMRGFEKLDSMGFIKTTSREIINETLVNDYMEAVKAGKNALVICPTHAQGEIITQEIRDRLREEKLLGKKEVEILRLKSLGLTEAERKDPQNFESGQVVRFNQNVKGFGRGTEWAVEKTRHELLLKNDEGLRQPLPTKNSNRFDVYEQDTIKVSVGDKILVKCNSFDLDGKRLDNGDMLEIVSVSDKDRLKLQNARSKVTYEVNKDFGHITYAHYVTSQASQGKTVDQAFVYQPAETFVATNAKQFYVSFSRAKEKTILYTTDKDELLECVQNSGERLSALEMVERSKDDLRDVIHYDIEQEKKSITYKEKNDYDFDR